MAKETAMATEALTMTATIMMPTPTPSTADADLLVVVIFVLSMCCVNFGGIAPSPKNGTAPPPIILVLF
jgi:hypothetical protein